MLSVYVPHGTILERVVIEAGAVLPEAAVWVDLITPTYEEDKLVENLLGIAVPTREEMQEIEVSSRLYVENGARFMTATLMCNSETSTPKTTPVTFVLSGHRLCTVRYDSPRPFAIVEQKLARACPAKVSGDNVLMDLLDAVIDRSADILERVGGEVDHISHSIFEPDDDKELPSYNDILKALGRKGDLTSKVRESLVSIGRLLLDQGQALAVADDAARRGLAQRSRKLSHQQDHLPARRHARRGQPPAERHHQDLLGCRGDPDAADFGRLDLRHEFQAYAGGRLAFRLSAGAAGDAARRRRALYVFQVAEVVVSWPGQARP
jgi:Mg2+ and Co2+ transporter CorA